VKRFEWIDHPSDVGFRAHGKDLPKALENAALALFEVMIDTEKVEPKEEVKIEIGAEDEKALLYDWLEHFLYLHDARDLVLSKFKIEKFSREGEGLKIKAKAWGEKFDPERHDARTEVKAITYHLMEIKCAPNRCSVQVVVDI
jgi:SHS2 domain-containing protein